MTKTTRFVVITGLLWAWIDDVACVRLICGRTLQLSGVTLTCELHQAPWRHCYRRWETLASHIMSSSMTCKGPSNFYWSSLCKTRYMPWLLCVCRRLSV